MSNLLSIAVKIYTAKIIANSKLDDINQETGYQEAILIRDSISEAQRFIRAVKNEQPILWATAHDGVQYSQNGEFFIRYKNDTFQLCDNAKSNSDGCLVINKCNTIEEARSFAEFIRTC
jgi:hypothetical protein